MLPKVYRVASVPVTLRQRQLAAVLWAGPGAALCNSTAAQAFGLLDGSLSHIEVVTQRRPIARPGFVAHRRRELPKTDLHYLGVLPVVAARRTLLDLCASATKSQAEIALDAALRLKLVSFEELRAMLGYATKHRLAGAALFREMLSVRGEEEAMSESELESAFTRVMRRAALPSPIRQVIVDWDECHRLDFVFPDHGLIVEVDGRKWHASRQRFAIDRRRDNAATLRGMRVLRLTWEDVTTDEPYVVDTVGRALGIIPLFRRSCG